MKTKLTFWGIAIILYFSGTEINAQTICFLPQANYAASAAPVGITSGDFNNDTFVDLAVTSQAGNSVSILLGTGTGTFNAAVNYPVGGQPYGIVTADFNEDGKLDIATGNIGAANNFSVIFGSGTGTFAGLVNYPVIGKPQSLAVGYINGDTHLDLAMVCLGTNDAIISLGNGTGVFAAPTYSPIGGIGHRDIALGLFNADAFLDLAITCTSSDEVSVLLGNGDGSFADSTFFSTGAGTGPYAIVVGDFNNDGEDDIATANNTNSTIGILNGNGNGSFVLGTNFATGMAPRDISIGDFNTDGKQDLAVANFSGGNISAYLQTGPSTFGVINNFLVGPAANSLTINDFNGDGKSDVATANQASANTSVLINNAPDISVSTPTNPMCAPAAATLTASGGSSYIWSTAEVTSSINVNLVDTATYTVVGASATGCEGTSSFTLNVLDCSGVATNTIGQANIQVYPNPFIQETTVEIKLNTSNKLQISLFNTLGEEVQRIERQNLADGNYRFNISVETKGVYILRTIVDGKEYSKKIIALD